MSWLSEFMKMLGGINSPLAVPVVSYSLATPADIKIVQFKLTELGILDPPPDGVVGPGTKWALGVLATGYGLHRPTTPALFNDGALPETIVAALRRADPLPIHLDGTGGTVASKLASRLIKAMLAKGYWITRHPDCMNIIYVRGMELNGDANDNAPNKFNDIRCVVQINEAGVPVLLGRWEATTEPSRYWTENPMQPGGAAIVMPGQYKAWQLGMHHTHEAWIQTGGPVSIARDGNKDYKIDGDRVDTGFFGINQHWGYDFPVNDLKNSSAGCLVGRSTSGHREFMTITKRDARFVANPRYVVMATVLEAKDVV